MRPPKNRVGGRYLATFSSNCFAINENQVAELVAAAILVATHRSSKGWVRDTCSRFLFRIFAFLFSASCKSRCRMDTAYVKDGYNISVFVSCKPCAPANLSQGRTTACPSRNNAARVITLLPRHAWEGTPSKRLNPRLRRDFGWRLGRRQNTSIFSYQRTHYKLLGPEATAGAGRNRQRPTLSDSDYII